MGRIFATNTQSFHVCSKILRITISIATKVTGSILITISRMSSTTRFDMRQNPVVLLSKMAKFCTKFSNFCGHFAINPSSISWNSFIAIRVDGYLSNPHSINSGVPQGSVISPVLFILFINDLLSSTSSSIFSFADDTYLSSSFSSNPQHLAYSDISPYRDTSASLLTNDLTNVEKWG